MKEALKLALEMVQNKMYAHAEMYLQETLAQPEQPAQPELGETPLTQDEFDRWFDALPWHLRARWPTQPAPVQQEPIEMYKKKCADGSRCLHGCHTNEPCYTTPPQPEQEPVTDEENEKFSRDVSNFKGTDEAATMYALEKFLRNRALAQPEQERITSKRIVPYSTTLSSLLNSPAHQNAMAQPEQEPVAWARYPRYTGKAQLPEIVFKKPDGKDWLELYTHAPQPEQEYESVLIDGVAYTIPSKVAVEILGLHLDLLQLKQEQEPVAWTWDTQSQHDGFLDAHFMFSKPESSFRIMNLQPLYARPPQRTWVGLAAEDRLTAKYMQDAPDGIEAVIDYIEAKLKEKNI
jgi:hypothetical protein